jgi:ATP-GRASP peptide maturase of grasp-with-spasm system
LQYAAALGLKIPNTIVTNCKKDLFDFLLKEQEIIIKPLSDAFTLIIPNEISLLTYTSEISKEKIEKMDDWFFTAMFQGLIKKKYEIRVFYLEPNFYSMAIFSQNDEKTTLDFRNYNDDKPNRNIPYKLPIFIEDKLRELMKKLNLQTGSIDLIKSYQNDYVFLEVNPVGQFGMTSKPCNYQIEKKIAQFLIQHDK